MRADQFLFSGRGQRSAHTIAGCATIGVNRIPRSIRKTLLAAGIRGIVALLAIGRGASVCGRVLAAAASPVGARILRGCIPLYRGWWVLRRSLHRAEAAGVARIVRTITHPITTYAVFAVIVLGVAAQGIHARERGGFIGSRPLLAAFVTSDDEEDATEETVVGPALPVVRGTFRAASVDRAFQPIVLGQEVMAASPASVVRAAFVQPVLTDAAVAETERAGIQTYVVEEGDTLSTIAEKFGIGTTTVLWENKLQAWSVIRPGDTLRILPVDGVAHTIAKGETLERIAARYRADAEDILEFNHLVEADDLDVGDLLIIPGGRPPAVVEAPVIRRAPVLKPLGPLPQIAGKFLWPSVGGYRISQYFTWRHHGVDIAVAAGTPVFASEAGTVVSSGWMRGYGYQVTIDHGNGLKTRYAHNSRLLAAKGQAVARGTTIALVGSTGRSTGPHIHYEVFANGVRVNPFAYLR